MGLLKDFFGILDIAVLKSSLPMRARMCARKLWVFVIFLFLTFSKKSFGCPKLRRRIAKRTDEPLKYRLPKHFDSKTKK